MTVLSAIIAVVTVIIGAVIDVRTRRIPNWLTVSGAGLGVVTAGVALGPRGALASATGFALGLLALLPVYAVRGLGAGDVKLFAAVGALLGPNGVLPVFVATAIAGGLMAIGRMVVYGGAWIATANLARVAESIGSGQLPPGDLTLASPSAVRLPYGVAIAAGTVAALIGRHVVESWSW